ncbi:hypothetical protein Pint_14966 [Pistacia integerrima]|uniref:Uncharacterized protein n=1 Tax=Pistacia integerrima TaxID=434235 RepID=A0ACC0ZAB2_9ROSI|nr:hypothetical protein Pint_14966 [Pistacia integerrima]
MDLYILQALEIFFLHLCRLILIFSPNHCLFFLLGEHFYIIYIC